MYIKKYVKNLLKIKDGWKLDKITFNHLVNDAVSTKNYLTNTPDAENFRTSFVLIFKLEGFILRRNIFGAHSSKITENIFGAHSLYL